MINIKITLVFQTRSHFVPLQASPAGLLGRFAPSALCARILGRFAPSGFALTKIFKKKCVSIDSKWSKTHRNAKKIFSSLPHYALCAQRSEWRSTTLPTPAVALLPRASRSHSRSLRSLGLRARYLPHDTPRVPRSVHAKFHHDRIMGARGIQTYIDRYIGTDMTVAFS